MSRKQQVINAYTARMQYRTKRGLTVNKYIYIGNVKLGTFIKCAMQKVATCIENNVGALNIKTNR